MFRQQIEVRAILAIVALVATVYALTQGDLWSAGLCAFGVVLVLRSYLRERRGRSQEVPESRSEG